jgi:ribosomal-protein-alanine N-acetyltransferase
MVAIRSIRRRDLEQVVQIERLSFPDPYPRRLLQWLAANLSTSFLVASDGDRAGDEDQELLGYAVGQVLTSADSRIGHVISVAVKPSYRRRGIGKQLMQGLIQRLVEAKCSQVRLEVRAHNTAALSLYEQLGFHRQQTIRGYYERGEDGVLLTLDLEAGR